MKNLVQIGGLMEEKCLLCKLKYIFGLRKFWLHFFRKTGFKNQ